MSTNFSNQHHENFINLIENQNSERKRIDWLDIAKGIGIILVVIGHGLCGKKASYLIFSFHMPLFFIIDGMFCKKYTVFSAEHINFIKKSFLRLIVPYLFTCLLIIIFSIILNLLKRDTNLLLSDIKNWILASIYGQGSFNNKNFPIIGAIWFLWAMFWGKIIFSFYSSSIYSFPSSIILFVIGYISSKYFYLPLSIQSGLTSIIFIFAGKKIKEKNVFNMNFVYLLLVCLELWICMLFVKGGKMSIVRNFYENIPANILSGICGTLTVLTVCKNFENWKFLIPFKFIGKYSLIFLCLHIIDLNLFPWGWIFSKLPMQNDCSEMIFRFFAKMLLYTVGCEIIIHSPLNYIYCFGRKEK